MVRRESRKNLSRYSLSGMYPPIREFGVHTQFHPQRPLHTTFLASGKRVNLQKISIRSTDDPFLPQLRRSGDATYDDTTKTVVIMCADGQLVDVHQLQTENRAVVSAWDWWNGVRLQWIEDGVIQFGITEEDK